MINCETACGSSIDLEARVLFAFVADPPLAAPVLGTSQGLMCFKVEWIFSERSSRMLLCSAVEAATKNVHRYRYATGKKTIPKRLERSISGTEDQRLSH